MQEGFGEDSENMGEDEGRISEGCGKDAGKMRGRCGEDIGGGLIPCLTNRYYTFNVVILRIIQKYHGYSIVSGEQCR